MCNSALHKESPKKEESMKNYSFEGARVVFCLIVFLNHWTMLFMPDLPIVIFNDGNLAVVFFLLLCGFVAPISIWNGTNNKNGGGEGLFAFTPLYLQR